MPPPPVVFHQDAPALSPSVLPRGDEWPALPARANTAHAAPALTETSTPDPSALATTESGKINSNRERPTNGQTASPSPPANQDSGVAPVASIRESDSDWNYAKLNENSPTSPANTPDLAGHIIELEEMYEVVESKIFELTRPMVLFSRIDKLELPDLDDAKTGML